jgi:hypothetical protein
MELQARMVRWVCRNDVFLRHLGIFYMPQICDIGQTALLPFRRKAYWGFFSPEKSDGFGREACMLITKLPPPKIFTIPPGTPCMIFSLIHNLCSQEGSTVFCNNTVSLQAALNECEANSYAYILFKRKPSDKAALLQMVTKCGTSLRGWKNTIWDSL